MSDWKMMTRRHALVAGAGVLAAPAVIGRVAPAKAAAPKLGPANPSFYRFNIGDFEVTTLLDGAIQLDGPYPIFGQNQPEEEVAAFAEENFLPANRMQIGFTPVIVNTGENLILFDTGNGALRRPNAGKLATLIETAGYSADQVDTVVFTHFHPDHIGGIMEDGSPLYANAAYVMPEAEYDFWSPEERASGPTERVGTLVQSNVVPIAERARFVNDGNDVVSGITAVSTHGHTPGHTCYHIESGGERLMLIGDATNHYVMSLAKPEWHVRFDMDKDAAIASRRKILDMIATDRIPFTGYHMPFPAVGYVEKVGDAYRYVAAGYQLDL